VRGIQKGIKFFVFGWEGMSVCLSICQTVCLSVLKKKFNNLDRKKDLNGIFRWVLGINWPWGENGQFLENLSPP
jgi:hypothetical protein